MNAPGKGILKTVSILFIIFGAIATLISLFAVLASSALTAVAGELTGGAGAAVGGILIVAMFVALIISALYLVLGIVGVGKRAEDPSKAGFYIVTGIILAILSLISVIIGFINSSFPWTSLVELVLAILYIVGGSMNKKVLVQQ